MDCKKKCKIKRVGALRGRWRVDCEKSAKLRGLGIKGGLQKKCKIKRVGALRGGLQKKVQN